ncbi:MAG: hypothetical protein K9K66_14425 [Desulfarculaceae bacterium]|nr:hypothetical protein [Desulfarculaceae bacterium]MCF8073869.1 hypothetical protein [Desulfarculaceae bacterium]MCF8102849.1 hypothetical protein [Desulfarculaceae bacterium]MCF8116293.1 hypothetical protein [Desulfarculaceae bacterium]
MTFFSIRSLPLMLGLLCLLSSLACSGEEPAKPKAPEFKKNVVAVLDRAQALLPLPYDEQHREALDQGLLKLFKEALQRKEVLDYGVAVVSKEARVVAARYPAPGNPEGVPRQKDFLDYSHYGVMKEMLKEGKSGTFTGYGTEGNIFAVCRPVKQGSKVGGGLCVGFEAEEISKKTGLSQKALMALDFNS